MTLYRCPKCGETFIYDSEDQNVCSKCRVKLAAICEWCEQPEEECSCGKDTIEA